VLEVCRREAMHVLESLPWVSTPSNTPATRRLDDANERLELARGRYLALL